MILVFRAWDLRLETWVEFDLCNQTLWHVNVEPELSRSWKFYLLDIGQTQPDHAIYNQCAFPQKKLFSVVNRQPPPQKQRPCYQSKAIWSSWDMSAPVSVHMFLIFSYLDDDYFDRLPLVDYMQKPLWTVHWRRKIVNKNIYNNKSNRKLEAITSEIPFYWCFLMPRNNISSIFLFYWHKAGSKSSKDFRVEAIM